MVVELTVQYNEFIVNEAQKVPNSADLLLKVLPLNKVEPEEIVGEILSNRVEIKPTHVLNTLVRYLGTSNKLSVVRALKEITGINLKEAKDLFEEQYPPTFT